MTFVPMQVFLFAVTIAVCRACTEECSWIGQTCGDGACCTGMDTRCGSNSVCSGMNSHCGPGSQCTGLGSQCESGEPEQPEQPEQPQHQPPQVQADGCETGNVCVGRPGAAQAMGLPFCCQDDCEVCSVSGSQAGSVFKAACVCSRITQPTTMAPFHMVPMTMAPWHTMTMAPWSHPSSSNIEVHAIGCDTGDACNGRASASESNGVQTCCAEACPDCSMSTSQVGSVLTATCVCGSGMTAAPPAEWLRSKSAAALMVVTAALPAVAIGMAAFAFMNRRQSEVRQALLAETPQTA